MTSKFNNRIFAPNISTNIKAGTEPYLSIPKSNYFRVYTPLLNDEEKKITAKREGLKVKIESLKAKLEDKSAKLKATEVKLLEIKTTKEELLLLKQQIGYEEDVPVNPNNKNNISPEEDCIIIDIEEDDDPLPLDSEKTKNQFVRELLV